MAFSLMSLGFITDTPPIVGTQISPFEVLSARMVLVLSTCHGLSHEEIASTVNMPLGTVKAHARRGLLRVRELLGADPQGAMTVGS